MPGRIIEMLTSPKILRIKNMTYPQVFGRKFTPIRKFLASKLTHSGHTSLVWPNRGVPPPPPGRIPRRCARQMQLNNVPVTTPSEYCKRAVSIPMLDHLESEINICFTELQSTAAKGMSIVPSALCVATTVASMEELDKNIDRLVTSYMADLEDDRNLVKEEIHQWKIEWQDVAHLTFVTKGVLLMWKGCLESCTLYRLHQLSAKEHLVAWEG